MTKFLWTQRTNFGPSPRSSSAIAYDSNRRRTVLFGGNSLFNGLHGDTWEWDGSFWTQMDDIGPFPRTGAAMVYDNARQISLLFGGIGLSGISGVNITPGDTWQWDGADWTQLSESGPSARSAHAMAFDSSRSRTVLFGGAASAPFGDTWEFDGEDWTQVQDAGPSPRSSHSMAYDGTGKRVVLFGGFDLNDKPVGDTWAWDGQEWVQIAEFGPSARFSGAMASIGGSLVFYGGGIDPTDPATPSQVYADTWEFDGKLWTQLQDIGPGPLQGASLAFDSGRSRVVLFGGLSAFSTPDPAALTGLLSGFTWESPIAQAVAAATVLQVSSLSVPASVHATAPTTLTVNLSGPAPEGGAVVSFGPTVFKPNLSHLPTVTVPADANTLTVPVGFQSPGISTITAQISGTPVVSLAVTVLP